MYILTIGTVKKAYNRLGNALNAFWKYFNKTPQKDLQNMSITNKWGSCLLSYTNEKGIDF